MNLNRTLLTTALLTVLATTSVFAARGPNQSGTGDPGTCVNCVATPVDEQEAATLTFMREEEKLARDIYREAAALWTSSLFANIANSEQQHMDAVLKMLNKYGLPDPVAAAGDLPGWFSDPELQQLYDDLAKQSANSLMDALLAGALIEEVDIEDNQNALDATDNLDLQQLYGNLLRGSRNHLRAFVGEIERLGVVYEAQHLEQEEVDTIVNSPVERGGSGNRGDSGGNDDNGGNSGSRR
ncbi:MAG TPA: DUF2202 domain-containing protein [Candidatus Competibacteraceae bacterium]|nr:DUF2202 domain-containing protein [Candidatus Competibacteraceae bacterium]